jgi:hypothetical protein
LDLDMGASVSLHDSLWVPKDGIGVEISSWIKPEIKLLLLVAFALAIHISMKNVRISTQVPQELKVYLIPGRPF